MVSRREVLVGGAGALAGGVAMLAGLEAIRPEAQAAEPPAADAQISGPAAAGSSGTSAADRATGYAPVVVPNGSTLAWKLVDGVKVYHLVAEPVIREFAPGLKVECWGYNGSTPGPVIEAVDGDRVRIYVTNRLPEPTSVHWHGILLPNGMDGVAGLTQRPIPFGATFKYEFTLRQSGTFMYHPHFDEMLQMGMGMMGMFVIHPREPQGPRIDRDFAIMLAEWAIAPGARRANTTVMNDFNLLTLNSKVFPATDPLVARRGDRVRIRLGNLGPTDHHPLHIHGHKFRVVGTDGGPVPESAQWAETSILVPVGTTRDIELVADQPGDWAFHCHMTHHTMNQMGHGLPNMLGVKSADLDAQVQRLLPDYMTMGEGEMRGGDMAMRVPPNSIAMLGGKGPFGPIDMGGMFTVLKVREHLASYDNPGSYQHPPGTVASAATAAELRADGIRVQG
jgi:FtsP/CotA-like multicopper oxidase with cupredoxin domain